jgi:predicted nicotinamide N-methyase
MAIRDVPGVRLHVADDVMGLSALAAQELGTGDPDLPYWAFPWAGGLALARYLVEHPEEVAGRHVLDVATGSGLCAIVAAHLGAASCRAVDVDPLAEAAVALNARANGVRISFRLGDVTATEPDVDAILAGDISYQETMAASLFRWLERAHERGIRVLVGDPGRAYLPGKLERLATYEVHTTRELEDLDVKASGVFAFAPRA